MSIMNPFFQSVIAFLTRGSIDDDNALRAKVDEAMTVYDEYVKTQGTEAEGEKKEEKAEAKA